MPGQIANFYGTLQAAVANAGTVTLPYPPGTNQATFSGGAYTGTGIAIINHDDDWTEAAAKVAFAFGASNITLTNNSGVTWPVGAKLNYGWGTSNFDYNFSGQTSPAPANIVTAAGAAIAPVAGTVTIPDVGAAYVQATINNALATLAAQIEALQAILLKAGITH